MSTPQPAADGRLMIQRNDRAILTGNHWIELVEAGIQRHDIAEEKIRSGCSSDGFYPKPLLDVITPSVQVTNKMADRGDPAPVAKGVSAASNVVVFGPKQTGVPAADSSCNPWAIAAPASR